MRIAVSEAAKRVGEVFEFEESEPIAAQEYGGRTLVFQAPLHVRGSFSFDGKGYAVKAEADTALLSHCARCNAAFPETYAFSLSERFVRQEVEDGESYAYSGDQLDLTQALMDNLFLHLPIVSLCRPDCKGLCPVCGCDRNMQVCSCDTGAAENPFSALSPLKDELKEV